MADIQINKPLYKSDGDDDFTPPTPREPRASLIGRSAALFLDIMLLHLVCATITRFVPSIPLALGPVAPWAGLLLGFLYFGFGFSHITLGRTVGKLITRVQVTDIAGPDLPVGRAFLRAALFLWPLPVQLIFRTIANHYAATDPTSVYASIEGFGTLLIFGWVLGNLGFAAFDPFGRTFYDRPAKSVVINAELEPEPVAAHLSAVRAADAYPPSRKSITALGLALTVCLAIAAMYAVTSMRQSRDMTPAQRERLEAMLMPGYGRIWMVQLLNENVTSDTVPLAFQIRRRGYFDMETLKADPAVTTTLGQLVDSANGPEFVGYVRSYMNYMNKERAKNDKPMTSAPVRMRVALSFVEYADLFFAKEAHPVYTVSRKVDLPSSVTQALNNPVSRNR